MTKIKKVDSVTPPKNNTPKSMIRKGEVEGVILSSGEIWNVGDTISMTKEEIKEKKASGIVDYIEPGMTTRGAYVNLYVKKIDGDYTHIYMVMNVDRIIYKAEKTNEQPKEV